MESIDTVTGGGVLFVIAPEQYVGDLTSFSHFAWDEFVPDNGNGMFQSTQFLIRGDDTVYQSDNSLNEVDIWLRKNGLPFRNGTGISRRYQAT